MANVLVINATSFETRVALVEEGTITEYYVERRREKGIVGNIYKGRVLRVLPGMQAAFVDLGTDKAGFLYVNDVYYDPAFSEETFELSEGEWGEGPEDLSPAAQAHLDAAYEGGDDVEVPAAEADDDADVADEAGEADDEETPESEDHSEDEVEAAAGDAVAEDGEEGEDADDADADDGESAEAEDHSEDAVEAEAAAEDADAGDDAEEAAAGDAEDAAADDGEPPEADSDETTDDTDDGDDTGALAAAEAAADDDAGDTDAEAADDDEGDDASSSRGRGGRGRGRGRGRRRGRGRSHVRPGDKGVEARKERRRQGRRAQIQDLLKEGQEIVVQVAKAPIGTKGARITTHISLPGRHLVFMPTVDHVGISRRIASDKERRRLRQLIEDNRPSGTGFIVRTVADGVDKEKLVADARFLMNLWADINKRKERVGAPALLHPDLDLILRATRDLFSEEVDKLVIDDPDAYGRVMQFIEAHMPALKDKVELYRGKEPIFDAYGIEDEIRRAQARKVWLKSGGYLIIDQAEALTAIDVNSGRYIGKKDLEETITKINIEAAEEVVYQLRLRNLGGIIILDFIDMEKSGNREKVFRALGDALRKDKAKTNILKISDLGLVEMTRKRVRESLTRMMHEACPYCDGRGVVRTTTTVAYEVLRDVMREAAHRRDDTVLVNCNPEVAALLTTVERDALRYVMDRTGKKLVIKVQDNYHREQYDLYTKGTGTGATAVVATSGDGRSRGALPPGAAAASGGEQRTAGRRRRRRRGRGRRGGSGSDGGGKKEPAAPAGSEDA